MHHGRPAPLWLVLLLRLRPWSLAVLVCLGPGCATLREQGQPLVSTRYETRTGPYVVYSGFPIEPDAPAVRSLQALERDIEANLGIRVRGEEPSVQVYILNDRQSFTHFLRYYYPELPPRRAFFLAQGSERVVYTFMGDRLEEDLRHEATHALLHVALGDLPLWLDEGLAEYFEGSEGRYGRNPEHLSRLPQDLTAGWTPDLARLEANKSVAQMDPRDYRESWAWVHYLLNHSNATRAALLGYLADLRANPATPPLSEKLKATDAGAPAMLLAHLDRLRTLPVASAAAPTIRLQDRAIEPARAPRTPRPASEPSSPGTGAVAVVDPPHTAAPPRRSLFDRFRGLFGFD